MAWFEASSILLRSPLESAACRPMKSSLSIRPKAWPIEAKHAAHHHESIIAVSSVVGSGLYPDSRNWRRASVGGE
jgi:hypothetical protein